MKNFENKEEYAILFRIKNSKTYDFKSSNKYRLYLINTKKLLIILLFSTLTFLLIKSLKFIYEINYKNQLRLIIKNNNKSNFLSEDFINITLPAETVTLYKNGNKLTFLTKEMVNIFNSYTNCCVNNILLDKRKYPLVRNPKISIIIPIYNGGKYLHYSLRSIQNQKMKDIEIIIIDDYSTDNSLAIIEKYMKEDERIRLIKNFENRKILYSKSFAALNSNGKYIIQLDQDDIFIRDDVFDILYNEAEHYNLDLVNIRDIFKNNFAFTNLTRVNTKKGHFILPKKTHFKKQPELKNEMYIDGNYYLLWGLLIKSDIYKKAVYHLWPIIINYKIIFHEDYNITFMLIILARKYKYLNNFGLIHLNHQYSTSKNCFNNDNYYLGVLFCGNTLFDYHINNNPKDIEIFTHYYSLFKNDFEKGKKFFPKLYSFLINKAIFNEYLSSKQKEFYLKQINLKESSSELIENYEYENIYNYQISDISNNKSNIIYIPNPKISIILFFTEYKYLDKTINSIQKQNFTNYEIILVFDNKEQNDIDLIQKYTKENPNINLINNKNSRGLLYSISVGALSSKGKYILILEPGSTLAKENTLIELYNIISNEKLDILEFNLLINNQDIINKNSLILYRCLHFKSKLNLEKIKYNKNYPKIDQQKELLINKLIRADLFKNSIEKYNLNKIKREAYNYYDNIFLYALQKTNKKFNHTNIYGVIKNNYYFNSLNINKIIENKKQKIKDTIFYINFILENSYNSFEEKKFVLNEYFNVMSIIYNKFNSINSESSNLYDKFMKCKYITQFDKKYLEFYYNSLTN